jgi:hypothetical protein
MVQLGEEEKERWEKTQIIFQGHKDNIAFVSEKTTKKTWHSDPSLSQSRKVRFLLD